MQENGDPSLLPGHVHANLLGKFQISILLDLKTCEELQKNNFRIVQIKILGSQQWALAIELKSEAIFKKGHKKSLLYF